MLFSPSHLMAIMTLGINSALVMDCGYTETLVLPVSLSCFFVVPDSCLTDDNKKLHHR